MPCIVAALIKHDTPSLSVINKPVISSCQSFIASGMRNLLSKCQLQVMLCYRMDQSRCPISIRVINKRAIFPCQSFIFSGMTYLLILSIFGQVSLKTNSVISVVSVESVEKYCTQNTLYCFAELSAGQELFDTKYDAKISDIFLTEVFCFRHEQNKRLGDLFYRYFGGKLNKLLLLFL